MAPPPRARVTGGKVLAPGSPMRRELLSRFALAAAVGGAGLFVYLVIAQGAGDLVSALETAGWGLALVALFHLVPMAADARGLQSLLPPARRLPFRTMLAARWLGESVNGLLPAAQIGGNVVKARRLAQCGVAAPAAAAGVVADLTLGVFTQIVFTLWGLALLIAVVDDAALAGPLLGGTAVMALLLWAFYRLQQQGLFAPLAAVAARLPGIGSGTARGGAAGVDDALRAIYRDRRTLLAAGSWRLAGWLVGAGEVWLAMHFLGHPVGWVEALVLESLGQAVRAAAFAVPGALGVQEGGYLVLGALLGLPPATALALALAKRVRELLLGLPGLLFWQWCEGSGWYRRRARARLER